jgi:uncharacterized protein with PIN domain
MWRVRSRNSYAKVELLIIHVNIQIGRRGDCQKEYWNGNHLGEGNEADPNLTGKRGLEE